MALVKRLVQIQREHNLTDGRMADMLHVNITTWRKTRTGDIPLGDKVRRGATRLRGSYPELSEAVLASLEEAD